MRHKREYVIERENQEFELLDGLMAHLRDEEWRVLLLRPETKDPWTVKDALAHIAHWKSDVARSIRKQRRPTEEQGLDTNAINHLNFLRWRDRSPVEVLEWHRQVHADVLDAMHQAPDEYFSGKERNEQWPFDLIGHSAYHRINDILRALKARPRS